MRRERRPEGDATAEGSETLSADESGSAVAESAQGAPLAPASGADQLTTTAVAPALADATAAVSAPVAASPVEPSPGEPSPVVQAAVAPPAKAEPAPAAPVPARAAVEPYVLPLVQLHQVAEGAGLQWVNSDADKIAAVQAAIAAQPKAAHTPRERKPVTVVDEGPLVLVETRKDLSQMKLPFEAAGGTGTV